MKQFLIFLIVALLGVLGCVSKSQATLFQFYQEQGLKLPSVASRVPDALKCGIANYSGTELQNTLLEKCLRLKGENVAYWVERISNNDIQPLTQSELLSVPEAAWKEVTPQLIAVIKQPSQEEVVGGAELQVIDSFVCRGSACDKYLTQDEQVGYNVATGYKTTLASSMTASQTTIPVASMAVRDGTVLTATALGNRVFLVVEPGSVREEISKCTDSTSSLWSSCTRGLSFAGSSEAASTTLAKAHNASSIVVMSNVHYVYEQFVDKDATEDVAGVKRFTSNTIKIGDGFSTTSHKIIYADIGTANLPFVRYNTNTSKWQFSDNGTDTVNLATSSAAGLSASSSKGIFITDSLIGVNASSTTGMDFGPDGKLYQKVSPTGLISSNSGGLHVVTNTAWTLGNTLSVSGTTTLATTTATSATIVSSTITILNNTTSTVRSITVGNKSASNLNYLLTSTSTNITGASRTDEFVIFSTTTIPGGVFTTSTVLRARLYMAIGLSSTKTATIKLYYGGTAIASATMTASGSQTGARGTLDATAYAITTNSQEGMIMFNGSSSNVLNVDAGSIAAGNANGEGTGSINAADDQSFAITIQFNNSNANDNATVYAATLEVLR